MKITLALVFVLSFASVSNAQCENGVCQLVTKVAATVQNVASVPFRVVSAVAQPVFVDESTTVEQSVAAPVPMRTPVRTMLVAPFRARPLQRLFRCR